MKKFTIRNQKHLITLGCLLLILAGAVSYMYFVSLSIVHVVMQKEATSTISQLQSEIAELETGYIAARHTISAQLASTAGFTTVENKVFISMAEQSLVLNRSY